MTTATEKTELEAEHALLWERRRQILVDLSDLNDRLDALDILLDRDEEK